MKPLFFVLALLLTGCNRYVISSINTKVGIKLDKNNLAICKGTNAKKHNGEPVGEGWIKAIDVQGVSLAKDDLYKPIINENIFQVLTDNMQKEFCHKVDVYNSSLNGRKGGRFQNLDYIVEFPNEVTLSEVFSDNAVTTAESKLKSAATVKNFYIPAELYTSFRNELRKQVTTRSTSAAKLRYIIIDVQGISLRADTTELPIQAMREAGLQPALNAYGKGRKIIMGIAGFSVTDFNSKSTVVQDKSMITAIDIAFKGASGELLGKINDIKSAVSLEWANTFNEKIQTEVNVNGHVLFYPLWIRYAKK